MAYRNYTNWNGTITYSNSTTSSGGYYVVSNYGGYNTTWNYTPKAIKDYKNKEMKHVLDKDRGW